MNRDESILRVFSTYLELINQNTVIRARGTPICFQVLPSGSRPTTQGFRVQGGRARAGVFSITYRHGKFRGWFFHVFPPPSPSNVQP